MHAPSVKGGAGLSMRTGIIAQFSLMSSFWRHEEANEGDFSLMPVGSAWKGALFRAKQRYTSFMDPSSNSRSVWDGGYFHISDAALPHHSSQLSSVVIALLPIPVLLC